MTTTENREAWLQERRRGIGGSDVHHVFSEPPYGCARRLWFDKRDTPADYPESESDLMRRGKRLEDLAAEEYAQKTGRKIETRLAMQSPTHSWARVNIDREIVGDDRGPGVLEVKTHGEWLWRKVKYDGLQPAHILQVQHALFVTGYSWGSYAILHPDSWRLLYFDVERDDALIATIVDAGERFWRQVEHGPMPDPLPEIDKRCASCPWRRQCRGDGILKAANLPRDDERDPLDRDEDLAPILADYREALAIADDANATVDAIKNAIRARMGARTAIECDVGRVYYRPRVSQRVDTAALKSKHPDIYKAVVRPSESRPLRIYPL